MLIRINKIIIHNYELYIVKECVDSQTFYFKALDNMWNCLSPSLCLSLTVQYTHLHTESKLVKSANEKH